LQAENTEFEGDLKNGVQTLLDNSTRIIQSLRNSLEHYEERTVPNMDLRLHNAYENLQKIIEEIKQTPLKIASIHETTEAELSDNENEFKVMEAKCNRLYDEEKKVQEEINAIEDEITQELKTADEVRKKIDETEQLKQKGEEDRQAAEELANKLQKGKEVLQELRDALEAQENINSEVTDQLTTAQTDLEVDQQEVEKLEEAVIAIDTKVNDPCDAFSMIFTCCH
jgi:chromosome segregation ATPase